MCDGEQVSSVVKLHVPYTEAIVLVEAITAQTPSFLVSPLHVSLSQLSTQDKIPQS